MSWLEHHRKSELLASDAETASHQGDNAKGRELYKKAAEAEENALREVGHDQRRTYGITAISAVSLYLKAAEPQAARDLALRCLDSERLPDFAYPQMKELLDGIKSRRPPLT